MSVLSRAVLVATTATRLDSATETDTSSGSRLIIHNNGAASVFIGGADVTILNGFPVASSAESDQFTLGDGEALYGICAAATVEVRVLEAGV